MAVQDFIQALNQLLTVLFIIEVVLTTIYSSSIVFIRQLHNRFNVLTLNITITGLLYSANSLIYNGLVQYTFPTVVTVPNCHVFRYIIAFFNCAMALSVVVVSLNRCFAIVYSKTMFFKTKQWMGLSIALQWLLSSVLAVPASLKVGPNCARATWANTYQLIVTVPIPTVIFLLANLRVFFYARASSRRVQPQTQVTATHTHTTTTTAPVETDETEGQSRKMSRRELHLLRHSLFMFSVLFMGWNPILIYQATPWFPSAGLVLYYLLALLAQTSSLTIFIDLFIYNYELRLFFKGKIQKLGQMIRGTS